MVDFPKKSFKLAGVSEFGNETAYILIIDYKMNLYCQITSWFVIIYQKVPRKPEKDQNWTLKRAFLSKNSIIKDVHRPNLKALFWEKTPL